MTTSVRSRMPKALPSASGRPRPGGVTLRLFDSGTPEDPAEPTQTRDLTPGADGTWLVRCDGIGHGTYYDYLVRFADGTVNRTADPWARAAGVNGRRSMVVDLDQTNPAGWAGTAARTSPAATW